MKTRFSTVDIKATLSELNQRLLGMRVANVYDIDNRTYLIKLVVPDRKEMMLIESGNRIHLTEFDWPKGMMPSGFSMKLRKHLRTRRVEKIELLGIDRIVDLQFGSGEAAYHLILELYDRGNLVLTDHEYTILTLLRPRTDDSQDVRIAVREKYPVDTARQPEGTISQERLLAILLAAKEGDNLKKILNPHLVYGPAVIEHCLIGAGLSPNAKLGRTFIIPDDVATLMVAMSEAEEILMAMETGVCKGYIIQKREKKPVFAEGEEGELLTYQEFHPLMFRQHEGLPCMQMDTFDKAVDEFFSKLGTQKLDNKLLQAERSALKKLENVKKDHEKRLTALQTEQDVDMKKGQLIEFNLELVDRAIQIVRSALANQIDWVEIQNIVKEAQIQQDPVASAIRSLQLDTNHITMFLKDPFIGNDEEEEEEDEEEEDLLTPMKVTIDLSLSAHANARKYFELKKHAAVKEQKTVDAVGKALKSAEKKTKQTLKDVQTVATINKARRTYWFEKFLWFITSENYLVIGGRDQQQNEVIVKRYFKPGDLYVHADLHGASSCIIKNPSGEDVPPKSMNEAGTMAICNSAAWDAKVVTSAWWVHHHQVSKTAPSGEYLTTGSFMIRGKKNYLPPSYLIYGFGFLFKVDDECIFRHKGERRVRTLEDDTMSVLDSLAESEISELSMDTKHLVDSGEDNDTDDSVANDSEGENEDDEGKKESNINTEEACKAELQDDKTLTDEVSEKFEMDIVTNANEGNDVSLPDARAENYGKSEIQVADTKMEDDNDEEALFPDTSLSLQHVKGDKFALHRHQNSLSASSQVSVEDEPVFLGDNQPIMVGARQLSASKSSGKLSAKQRRELKKKAKQATSQESQPQEKADQPEEMCQDEDEAGEENGADGVADPHLKQKKASAVLPPPPMKRGQKAKMKKMREKYKDQDDEERQLRMELLASAGSQKEAKKKGKKNKQKQQQQQQKQQQEQQEQQQKGGNQSGRAHSSKGVRPVGKLTIEDITVETLTIGEEHVPAPSNVPVVAAADGEDSDEEKQAILDDENVHITNDADILDSLTGCPVTDDILLFAVPVCAPYQALTSYKYKVKLLPGTTKRGKAPKTAIGIFQREKYTSQREKDLFKSLKDQDLSRNIPGKVKLSAPNLQKAKRK